MNLLQRFNPRLSLLTLLALPVLVYSMFAAEWRNPISILSLGGLLVVMESVPIRMRRFSFTFSYPIIFALVLMTDHAIAAMISACIVGVIHWCQRKPLRTLMFNAYTRLLAVSASGLALFPLDALNVTHFFRHYFLQLVFSVIIYSVVSTLFVLWFLGGRTSTKRAKMMLLKMSLVTIGVSVLYDGGMLLLASNPKNLGSGTLGTVFFFIPLIAITIVLHLFSNLTRAKQMVETVFAVSESINRSSDLPTVLSQVICEATRLVHGSCGQLYLVQETGELKRVCGTSAALSSPRISQRRGLAWTVAQTGYPALVHDVTRDTRYEVCESEEGIGSLLVVPIRIDGKVAGVISLAKKEKYSFLNDDLKLMMVFATHAAVAMKNAEYLAERERRLLVEERNRLAREIHDGIAQELAGTILQLEMLKRHEPHDLAVQLNDLQETLRQTANTVRSSIYSLRPAPYTHVGLLPAIKAHLDEVEAHHPLRTHLQAELPYELPTNVSHALFQIITESVQNAVKHAEASHLWLTLRVEEGMVRLKIKDDGRGFHFGQAILEAAERHSFGIENLYHLAEQVGGTLDILTAPGQGTVVTAEIPTEVKEEEEHEHTSVAL